MGLNERRIQDEFEKKRMPETVKNYNEKTAGIASKIKIQVEWASFGNDTAAYENLWSIWEQPLQGVEAVCQDDLGREAVKKSLKAIVIKNVKSPEEVKAEFKDGILTAYFNAAEGTSGTPGWTAFQEALEKEI